MPRIYKNPCTIEGCNKKSVARGWCYAHYGRWRRNSDPLGGNDSPGKTDKFIEGLLSGPKCEECVDWPYAKDMDGRAKVTRSNRDGTCRTILAARYILEKIEPAPNADYQALHDCGKGHEGCVNPHHLYWGTSQQNALDKKRHGTAIRGEENHKAKLNEKDVLDIRSLVGISVNEIASKYDMSASGIRAVLTGRSWSYLES